MWYCQDHCNECRDFQYQMYRVSLCIVICFDFEFVLKGKTGSVLYKLIIIVKRICCNAKPNYIHTFLKYFVWMKILKMTKLTVYNAHYPSKKSFDKFSKTNKYAHNILCAFLRIGQQIALSQRDRLPALCISCNADCKQGQMRPCRQTGTRENNVLHLQTVSETMHSCLQNMIDSCVRTSLLLSLFTRISYRTIYLPWKGYPRFVSVNSGSIRLSETVPTTA